MDNLKPIIYHCQECEKHLDASEVACDSIQGQYYHRNCGCVLRSSVIDPQLESRHFADGDKGDTSRVSYAVGPLGASMVTSRAPRRGHFYDASNVAARKNARAARDAELRAQSENRDRFVGMERDIVTEARRCIARDPFLQQRAESLMSVVRQTLLPKYIEEIRRSDLKSSVKADVAAVLVFLAAHERGLLLPDSYFAGERGRAARLIPLKRFKSQLDIIFKLVESKKNPPKPPAEAYSTFFGLQRIHATAAATVVAGLLAHAGIERALLSNQGNVAAAAGSLMAVLRLLPPEARLVAAPKKKGLTSVRQMRGAVIFTPDLAVDPDTIADIAGCLPDEVTRAADSVMKTGVRPALEDALVRREALLAADETNSVFKAQLQAVPLADIRTVAEQMILSGS